MQKVIFSTLVSIGLLLSSSPLAFSQTGSTAMSKKDLERIAKVKKDLADIGVGNTITVSRLDNRDVFGRVKSIGADDFEVAESDSKQVQIFKYADIKNVRSGDGQRGYISGRKNNRSRPYVLAGLIGGLIVGLLVIANEIGKD